MWEAANKSVDEAGAEASQQAADTLTGWQKRRAHGEPDMCGFHGTMWLPWQTKLA